MLSFCPWNGSIRCCLAPRQKKDERILKATHKIDPGKSAISASINVRPRAISLPLELCYPSYRRFSPPILFTSGPFISSWCSSTSAFCALVLLLPCSAESASSRLHWATSLFPSTLSFRAAAPGALSAIAASVPQAAKKVWEDEKVAAHKEYQIWRKKVEKEKTEVWKHSLCGHTLKPPPPLLC